jgi:hypothetical protein
MTQGHVHAGDVAPHHCIYKLNLQVYMGILRAWYNEEP